jgi:hypothetical protein
VSLTYAGVRAIEQLLAGMEAEFTVSFFIATNQQGKRTCCKRASLGPFVFGQVFAGRHGEGL